MKIVLENVSKSYGKLHALDKVSCVIEPGQIVSLLGANGAGKTSLIRCLAGIAAPDKGVMTFDGERFRRDNLKLRRRMYFLPDFPPLFLQHSVLRNIATILRLYEVDTEATEQRVLALLRDFDLLALAQLPVKVLSRGQIYKTALVAMIAADCDLWLLDEPFASGMDPHGINAFKRHAVDAVSRDKTIIYSTQLLDVVERFSDRVCLLHRGAIRAFDTLAHLRDKASDKQNVLDELFGRLREVSN
jgi:ABC-type multidrug transport system ATPase subunit